MTILKSILRRGLLESAAVAVGMAIGERLFTPALADGEIKEKDKIKKADAKYQDQPKGEQRCEICLQFEAPSTCKIVQGPITPHSWCQFFAAKENAH